MKYLNIVKNWIITKWNGTTWDLFVLGVVALALITGLAVIIS